MPNSNYYAPLDPECEEYVQFLRMIIDDDSINSPINEIMEDFENRHRVECKKCSDYGSRNIRPEM